MMGQQQHRIELRTPDKLWATWDVSDAGMELRHDLDDVRIETCPGFMAYENGRPLHLTQGAPELFLNDSNGLVRLKVNTDEDGILTDVVDPRGKAYLSVELRGPGSVGNQPVQNGELVLTLKPIRR
jgi:hypothetical protein